MGPPVPPPRDASLELLNASIKRAVDAATQTDEGITDQDAQATLSITLPHSQLSFLHIEESNQKTKDKKRLSAIFVSTKSGSDRASKDDVSVSISMSNRYSVSSVKSLRSTDKPLPQRPGTTNSIVIAESDSDNAMLPSARKFQEFATESKSLDEFVPAPAYEEVALEVPQPKLPSMDSCLQYSAPSTREASGMVPEQPKESAAGPSSIRATIMGLPKLPPLAANDYIIHSETASTIQALVTNWPVLKSGLLFRKEINLPASGGVQLRSLDRPSTVKMVGRSLGTLIKGKRRARAIADAQDQRHTGFNVENEEWSLYYAEVRGRYLMFYTIQEPARARRPSASSGSVSTSVIQQTRFPPGPLSPLTHPSLEGLLHRPFAKIFNTLGKRSSRPGHARRPSAELTSKRFGGRTSGDEMRRASNDQQRSIVANLSSEGLKNAPRTLVHYLPLHKAMVNSVAQAKMGALTTPGNSSSYVSVNSIAGNSHLVLFTTPVERHHEAGIEGSLCDQFLLDAVLHEDLLSDSASVNQQTVSTLNSAQHDSHLRRLELTDWAAAIRTASDLSYPKGTDTLAYPSSARHSENDGTSVTPVEALFKEGSITGAPSVHSKRSTNIDVKDYAVSDQTQALPDTTARSERQTGEIIRSSPTDLFGSASPRVVSKQKSASLKDMQSMNIPSTDGMSRPPAAAVQPQSSNNKSFTKLFSSKWKMTFEKEAPRPKPIISGPTNFTKIDISPEMLLQNAGMAGSLETADLTTRPRRGSKPPLPPRMAETSAALSMTIGQDYDIKRKEDKKRTEKGGLNKKKSHRDEEKDIVPTSSSRKEREKEKEKEKKREVKEKSKFQKASASSLAISGPLPISSADATDKFQLSSQRIDTRSQHTQRQDDQPSVSTSKLFFPFFNKSLFTSKEKEIPITLLPVADRLQRTATVSSRASTLRRKVGKARPASSGTMASDRGTIGSGTKEEEGHVPLILKKCIALVEEIGMQTEGLYRISGSAASVERLRRLLTLDPSRVHLQAPPSILPSLSSAIVTAEIVAAAEKIPALTRRASRLSLTETVSSARSSLELGTAPEDMRRRSRTRRVSTSSIPPAIAGFSGPALYDNDVHVVTGVIKAFLRDGLGSKKVPVCTFDLYEGFISATQMVDWRTRMIGIQDMVHSLPPNHFATLKFICEHLNRVASESDKNRMSIRNLSIIFGPTLLRPPPALDNMARIIEDMPFQCTVVETLIEQVDWVFGPIEYEEVEGDVVEGVEGSLNGEEVEITAEDSPTEQGAQEAQVDLEDICLDSNDDTATDPDMGRSSDVRVAIKTDTLSGDIGEAELASAAEPTETAVGFPPGGAKSGRLRPTQSKIDRRRGQVLPSVIMDDLDHTERMDASPSASIVNIGVVSPDPTGNQQGNRPSARSPTTPIPLPPSPHTLAASPVPFPTPAPRPSFASDQPPPRLSLNLDMEDKPFLDI